MGSSNIGSGLRRPRIPSESRRWLKPRVPRHQLYRLAPRKPPASKRRRILDAWDRLRYSIRTWWAWAALTIALLIFGHWIAGIATGFAAFIFALTQPRFHPAEAGLDHDFAADSPEFLITMTGLTGMPFVPGNSVQIFNNGDEFYPAILEAIEEAKTSVTMEMYIFWSGAVGRRFAEALSMKAREGVPVKLLVDAIGSSTIGEENLRILEAGGCQLAWFRPIRWYTLIRANFRLHRKSIIVDGRVAFSGGAGIADQWLGRARSSKEWRDVMIRVEGPAAQYLQTGFAQNWLINTGELVTGSAFFPVPISKGEVAVQTILSSPAGGAAAAGTMYMLALNCARKYLYIANPYFIPSRPVIEMLGEATRRGVDVKLMLSGDHCDTWWARQNSIRLYGRLMDAGVEIYEYVPTMMHQKTMVVDGVWATVGSANFDNRSLALNDETSHCFYDPGFVEEVRQVFLEDLQRCRRIDRGQWSRRGLWSVSQEVFASLIQDQV